MRSGLHGFVAWIWLPCAQVYHDLVELLHPQIPLIFSVGTQPVPAHYKGMFGFKTGIFSIKAHKFTFLFGSYVVTHSVSLHWLTRVSRSPSLCGLTVMSSKVLGRAQNSRFAGSTLRLVQLARLMRLIGFCGKNNNLLTWIKCISINKIIVGLPFVFHHQGRSKKRCNIQKGHTTSCARLQIHSHPQT